MSVSDSTAPNQAYRPTPAPAVHDLETARLIGCVPAQWVSALWNRLPGPDEAIIMVEGTAVAVRVGEKVADLATVEAAYGTVSDVVRRSASYGPRTTVICKELPPQILSAHWTTTSGDVTLVRPGAQRRGWRRRMFGLAPVAAWLTVAGQKTATVLPLLGTAAGVVAIAGAAAPAASPASPRPHHARPPAVEQFAPYPALAGMPSASQPANPSPRPTTDTSPASGPAASSAPSGSDQATTPAAAPTSTATSDPTPTPGPVSTPEPAVQTSPTPAGKKKTHTPKPHPSKGGKHATATPATTVSAT